MRLTLYRFRLWRFLWVLGWTAVAVWWWGWWALLPIGAVTLSVDWER